MQINVSLTYLYTFLDTPPVVIGMDGTPTRWNGLIITLCRFDWEFSCKVQMFVQYRSTVSTYGKPLDLSS